MDGYSVPAGYNSGQSLPIMPMPRQSIATDDLRNQPAYTLAEAARYLKLPPATLRSWVVGRDYPRGEGKAQFERLITPASNPPPVLSFWNLIEAHVLRSLRSQHGVAIPALRNALGFAEAELGIERLLLNRELCTAGGRMFLERYGALIELSRSGQLTLRHAFEEHMKRVDWDDWQFPVRLHPFVASDVSAVDRPISIDPKIAFGRPVITRAGVSTAAIADRIDANEDLAEIAEDYGLTLEDIERAVLFERAA